NIGSAQLLRALFEDQAYARIDGDPDNRARAKCPESGVDPSGRTNRLDDLLAETVDATDDKERGEPLIAGHGVQKPSQLRAEGRWRSLPRAPSYENGICARATGHRRKPKENRPGTEILWQLLARQYSPPRDTVRGSDDQGCGNDASAQQGTRRCVHSSRAVFSVLTVTRDKYGKKDPRGNQRSRQGNQ